MAARADIGIFTTLTSLGSRALVGRVLQACRDREIAGARPAFVLVNRAPGESEVTDASVALLSAEHDIPFLRVSAVRFRREARKAARRAAKAGDDAALWAWRDAWWDEARALLPPADLDLCLGDMWIWGAAQCRERRGVNLHPALPSGPAGKMWFDVIWDLIESDALDSGVMLHRVTPAVDEGPVVSWCRYGLRDETLDPLWAALPEGAAGRAALAAEERPRKREAASPLFHAIRAKGAAREVPLVLETMRAVADGRLKLAEGRVLDGAGAPLEGGLDLSAEVEARTRAESDDTGT